MKITYDSTYNGYKINNNKDKGCYEKILHRIYIHTKDMLRRHSKVLTLRFDLRTSTDEGCTYLDSKKIDRFIENIIVDLMRNSPFPEEGKKKATSKNLSRHSVDPRIIIVMEENDSEKPHAHCIILVNGNAKKCPMDILNRVERQYKNVLKKEYKEGLVDYCNRLGKNSYLLKRDDEKTLNKFSRQASYLAKIRGKDRRGKGLWIVRGTRIPSKNGKSIPVGIKYS